MEESPDSNLSSTVFSFNESAYDYHHLFYEKPSPLANLSCVAGEPVPDEQPLDKSIFLQFNAPTKAIVIPWWEITIKVIAYVFAFLLAIVGNTVVILIICFNKKMRSTTNILLLNQAIADLLVALICMWVHLGNQITTDWPFGSFVCKVNTFAQVLAVTASVLTLTAISVERFTAIVFPLKARWTATVSGAIIATTWISAAAVASPHLFVRILYEQQWKDRDERWCDEKWTKVFKDDKCNAWEPGKVAYYCVEAIVIYFVPVLIMIVAYAIITVKLLTRKTPGTLINTTVSAHEKAKRKVIKMLVAVLVCFVVCWTPQHAMLIWDLFRPREAISKSIREVKFVAVYVAYFNSALNPILYGGFNDNFRRGFQDVFRCLVSRQNKVHPAPPPANLDLVEQGQEQPNLASTPDVCQQPRPRDTTVKNIITVSTLTQRVNEREDSGRPTTANGLSNNSLPPSVTTTGPRRPSVSSDDTTIVPWQSLQT